MIIIIAPHPDDELLCGVLQEGIPVDEIVYVAEVIGGRDVEAIGVAKHYGFRPVFCHGIRGLEAYLSACKPEFIIYAPTKVIGDHPMHRMVADLVKRVQEVVGYTYIPYIIDIDELSLEEKELIVTHYPSQRWLIDREMRI